MKKTKVMAFACLSLLAYLNQAGATIPNTDHPTTFLGPALRLGFSNYMNDTTAYALAAELGIRNYRLDGTFGWQITYNQRVKLTAEYLRQDITYAFFDGNSDQWVHQGAIGAEYEHDFNDYLLNPQFTLGAYLSHAPSKTLRTDLGTYTNADGIMQPFRELKRIAGSNAGGLSPGVSFSAWPGAKINAELNYDKVHYDTEYVDSENPTGFGGTVSVHQAITDDFGVRLLAAIRQPFNNYQANFTLGNVPFYGKWAFGFNTAYTVGKNALPSTYIVGISADYFMEQISESPYTHTDGIDRYISARDNVDFKGVSSLSQQAERQDFLSWVSRPAVYMPQVLAIADSRVSCQDGEAPTALNSTLPPDFNTTELSGINLANNFTGSNLTFAVVSVTPDPQFFPSDFVNMTANGTLTYDASTAVNDDRQYFATISAANTCGVAYSSITLGPIPE
ncbi:hypothetical protein AQUSIP_22780 [Aquicella siphonis]|uniref:Inverse autotransporter beta-domain domain-containing protein n=1 Tax=Aquicella siphonis TaxID=254247 RepID=A0A5E4PKL1_9COXI|nr:hypothetical protein [Aquicella siphonis]VVC76951.1 hypothetical protein AQUSIP_22780 [Aquicella siphonis]